MTKKPDPLFAASVRRVCPVCGKNSYSKDGIHPQCAVIQAEAPRMEEIRKEKQRQRAIDDRRRNA